MITQTELYYAQSLQNFCSVYVDIPRVILLVTVFFIIQHKERSGSVLDSRPRGRRFEPHRRHCVVSLSKNINPSLELVQPRKTRPFITERLLMGRKESNQTNKQITIQPEIYESKHGIH